MMGKPRFLPPDPMEAAKVPLEGVDLPESGESETEAAPCRADRPSPSHTGKKSDEATEAAQRGRIA